MEARVRIQARQVVQTTLKRTGLERERPSSQNVWTQLQYIAAGLFIETLHASKRKIYILNSFVSSNCQQLLPENRRYDAYINLQYA